MQKGEIVVFANEDMEFTEIGNVYRVAKDFDEKEVEIAFLRSLDNHPPVDFSGITLCREEKFLLINGYIEEFPVYTLIVRDGSKWSAS